MAVVLTPRKLLKSNMNAFFKILFERFTVFKPIRSLSNILGLTNMIKIQKFQGKPELSI